MIPTAKSKLLQPLFRFYFQRLARQAFHTIAVRGLEHLQTLSPDEPVLVFSNHTNWWDGLLAYLLQPYMKGKEGYLMMEEKQLRHYRFFSRMGAFSVDLSGPTKAAASLRYALKLLQNKESLIWIFPQGKICPPQEEIGVMPGTSFLAQKAGKVRLVPVAFRYEFFRENRPNALIEIGPPLHAEGVTDEKITQQIQALFTRVNVAAERQNVSDFTPLFPPRLSINKKWEWVRLALRGRLSEFRANN